MCLQKHEKGVHLKTLFLKKGRGALIGAGALIRSNTVMVKKNIVCVKGGRG